MFTGHNVWLKMPSFNNSFIVVPLLSSTGVPLGFRDDVTPFIARMQVFVRLFLV